MSEQLNLEARIVRLLLDNTSISRSRAARLADAIVTFVDVARRAAPVGEVELPALPEPDVIAYTCVGDNDAYSPQLVKQIVAKRDERIRVLERELTEYRLRKDVQEVVDGVEALKARVHGYQARSIDSFKMDCGYTVHRDTRGNGHGWLLRFPDGQLVRGLDQYEQGFIDSALRAGMACGRTAGAAPELYTCIGKGGTYELVGKADGAGYVRGGVVTVYRDTTTGNLYYRTPVDFGARMERIAAAPSPQHGKEGGDD